MELLSLLPWKPSEWEMVSRQMPPGAAKPRPELPKHQADITGYGLIHRGGLAFFALLWVGNLLDFWVRLTEPVILSPRGKFVIALQTLACFVLPALGYAVFRKRKEEEFEHAVQSRDFHPPVG